MRKFFSISQAAKMVDMTPETLRHYDRIGLVEPCKIDEFTGYRYYSHQEIVRLNTIRALRVMDLSLMEIKEILEYNDLSKIIKLLHQAEKTAEHKIVELNYAITKIQTACTFYESKLKGKFDAEYIVKDLPQRVILLSKNLQSPSLENLWDYHRHFYQQLGENFEDEFSFEDLAGIYEENERSQLFAVCNRYTKTTGIKILPKGNYLCANCTEYNKKEVTEKLIHLAKEKYNKTPKFMIHIIVLTGILQWNYQTQVYIE